MKLERRYVSLGARVGPMSAAEYEARSRRWPMWRNRWVKKFWRWKFIRGYNRYSDWHDAQTAINRELEIEAAKNL